MRIFLIIVAVLLLAVCFWFGMVAGEEEAGYTNFMFGGDISSGRRVSFVASAAYPWWVAGGFAAAVLFALSYIAKPHKTAVRPSGAAEKTCPACKRAVAASDKYCVHCGTRI